MFAIVRRLGVASATVLAVAAMAVLAPASAPAQSAFSREALSARVPVVREHTYVVNAKVRPLLLFWIGRDDIGDARITWRQGPGHRRAFELLVGSDPARAPRRVNRWGYIVEELDGDKADILGVMSQSNEETLEEAEAKIAREGALSTFKASRAAIVGSQAVGGAMTLQAPARLTYRDLDALLLTIPASPPAVHTSVVPPGTHPGFLVAMASLMHAAEGPCRTANGGRPKGVAAVRYLYNQTVYGLSFESCRHQPEFRTKTETFADLVDGRFQITNTTTKRETDFRILYGASDELRGVPVRAVFRPRWWMEVELVLDRSGAALSDRSLTGRATVDAVRK